MPTYPDDTPLGTVRQMLNATGIRQNGFVNARPPINTDDANYGWEVGSRWWHDGVEYVCKSNSVSAAVWELSGIGDLTQAQADARYALKSTFADMFTPGSDLADLMALNENANSPASRRTVIRALKAIATLLNDAAGSE